MEGIRSLSLTEDQIDEVARRYRHGESIAELAVAFEVSTSPIRNALRLRSVRIRVGGHRRGWVVT